jgi:hypothetical protein
LAGSNPGLSIREPLPLFGSRLSSDHQVLRIVNSICAVVAELYDPLWRGPVRLGVLACSIGRQEQTGRDMGSSLIIKCGWERIDCYEMLICVCTQ